LSTPFQRRTAGTLPMGKTMALALVILALAGFALAKLGLLPVGDSQNPNPSVAGTSQTPATTAEGYAPSPEPEPVAAPTPSRPTGSVAVTDDDDSTKAFLRKATSGSPEDQYQVGLMYEQGKDVPRNDTAAFRWYRKAAVQGLT